MPRDNATQLAAAAFVAVEKAPLTCARDQYGAIFHLSDGTSPDAVIEDLKGALPELGIESFSLSGRAKRLHGKKGWQAVNADLYGWDPEAGVAVVQIRQSQTGPFGIEVQKTYALVGRNEETKAFFRHPISAAAVHGAIRRNDADPVVVVRGSQKWMWRCTERQLEDSLRKRMRQGDVLMIAVRGEPKGDDVQVADFVLGESHRVVAEAFREDPSDDDAIYALSPRLVHTKDQHAPVTCDYDGWYSIRLAREAAAWRIAARLGD